MRALGFGERLIDDEPTRSHGLADRLEQIALEIPSHEHEGERIPRQSRRREIGTPSSHDESIGCGVDDGVSNGVVVDVDAERLVASGRQQQRVSSASHRDVEGPPRPRRAIDEPDNPALNERRRWIEARRIGHTDNIQMRP